VRKSRSVLATFSVFATCFMALAVVHGFSFQNKNQLKPISGNLALANRAGTAAAREVFDPVLAYSTYLGGSTGCCSGASAMFVDGAGNVYVGGGTGSLSFPTTPNVVQPTNNQPFLGFLEKIDPTGQTLIFSTYLAGLKGVSALTVDSSGNVYVVGPTQDASLALPIPSGSVPYQSQLGNIGIIKLNSSATAVLSATYLGGSGSDAVSGIAVDSSHNVYVSGTTTSNDFPVTANVLQSSLDSSGFDGFVTKLNANLGALAYSTYVNLGQTSAGAIFRGPRGLAVDANGDAYFVGQASPGFAASSGAYQTTCTTDCAMVLKLNPAASGSLYATYIGEQSIATAIAVDTSGNIFFAGATISAFPTPGGTCSGPSGFVAEINAAGSLAFAECVGGDAARVSDLVVDQSGRIYVAGSAGTGLTLQNAIDASPPAGGGGLFVASFDPTAPSLLFSSFVQVGYTSDNVFNNLNSVGVDSAGNIYVAGIAGGPAPGVAPPTLPVFNALQSVPGVEVDCAGIQCESTDAFVLKIAPTDAPAAALDPAQLVFPVQAPGTTSDPQTVTITNMGSASLTVSNVAVTGEFAIQNNCSTVAAAGGTCTIAVTFSPTSTDPQTGTLTITDNSAGSPRTVALSGQPGQATLSVSPTSLSFGNQAAGTTSSAQTVTVQNTGTLSVQISRVGTSPSFSESNTCGSSFAVDMLCSISVSFAPMAAGAASGTLMITDSATNSPQIVALSGTGTGSGSGSGSGPGSGSGSTSIGLGTAPGGSTSATVTAGQTATYPLSIGGAGVSGTASLTCTGAPSGAICAVPTTIPLSATAPSMFSATITTTARSSGWVNLGGPKIWLWPLLLLMLLTFKSLVNQRAPRLRWSFAPALLALTLCACGGGGNSTMPTQAASTGTPTGTYSITVTAKSGAGTQTQTLTLSVK
jgi:Beta-propeller repeat/Abnormal spindle-like microcephaly-assoc'd, ASPM-SPD-2-Hydin